ncbi:helix-turn-helix domain-containing protein [Haloferula sp.]|uniref:PAS domain-containing protein n=1 Tax=Haloferula sp. TaxID=2497595 RepID=UPI003C717E58
MDPSELQKQFFDQLSSPCHGEEVFDEVPDTVYFIKDQAGRYISVNDTLVRRCRLSSKHELIGKTALEVFPSPFGREFTRQDLALLAGGAEIREQLELHLYPGGKSGWCLTWKKALRGSDGGIVGLSGISRDLSSSPDSSDELHQLSTVLDHIRDHLSEPLSIEDIASDTGLSVFQIGQRIKRLFGISPYQYIIRCRIDSARHLLANSERPLSEIALACGFSDQSAFTRQFKRSVGIPPGSYRGQLGDAGKG